MSFQEFSREMERAGGRGPERGGGSSGQGPGVGSQYQAAVSQVFQMSTSLTGLRRLVDMLGGPKDTLELRHRAAELKEKISHMAKSVTSSLKEIQAPAPGQPQPDKAAVAKLISDFEGVLKEFQRLQKLLAEKGTQYKPKVTQTPSYVPASATGFSLEQQEEQALLEREQNKQEMIQLDNMIEYNHALIEERDAGIAEIQQQIVEVNEIFQDLAVLVNDQGAQLLDIEANVLSAAENTGQARQQLVMAQRSQKRNRRCWCWMALIAIMMVTIFVFILQL